MSLGPLLKKEGRVILRSRLLLLVLLLYPLVLVGIIGYAFSQPNQNVPIAVVNEDLDAQGRPNVEPIPNPIEGQPSNVRVSTNDIIIGLAPFADVRLTDQEEARHLLLTGEVQAIVRFPPNFARDIVNYQTSGRVEIVTDQSDPVRAAFMEVLIRGVVQQFQEEIVRQKVELVVRTIDRSLALNLPANDPLYPGFQGVRDRLIEVRDTNQDRLPPDQLAKLDEAIAFMNTIIGTLTNSRGLVDSVAQPVQVRLEQEASGSLFIRDLVVPAALGLGIFWTGSLATSALVVYERESAAYTRLRITPATAFSIYGSKVLVTLFIILTQSLLILATAVFTWGTRVDNPGLTLTVILFSCFASMALGLFLAGITRDVTGAVLLSVLITFPMLFLAGLFYPVSFMPAGAQILADFFPLTHTVAALRGAMLRGFAFGDALTPLLALAAFTLILGLLGFALNRRLEARR
jgi:ABC-type multidrug transport system permease subunit